MKVIIAGGRLFRPNQYHEKWLNNILDEIRPTEIVSGCCTGADEFGERIARIRKLPIKQFKAEWALYGKQAGPIRNCRMAKYADVCILFPGGSGTLNMKNSAVFHGLQIFEYKD